MVDFLQGPPNSASLHTKHMLQQGPSYLGPSSSTITFSAGLDFL